MRAPIVFDRNKYGRDLRVDACDVATLRNFITGPVEHRLRFHEVALLTGGSGTLDLDGTAVAISPNIVCFTRPGQVRRWRLLQPLRGDVVFFESAFLDDCLGAGRYVESLPAFGPARAPAAVTVAGPMFRQLARVARDMKDELWRLRDDSAHLLRAHLYRLLVEAHRHAGLAERPARASRHLVVQQRFARLLDERFRELRRVADYADRLGITADHLNDCVQRAIGTTASAAIQDRVYREARRMLLYSDLSAARIAADLDFSDASYFNRFFRRMASMTPREFRLQGRVP